MTLRIAYVINSVEGGGAALPVPAVIGLLRRGGAEVKLFALTRRDGRALPAIKVAGIPVAVREGGEKDHWLALRWLEEELRAWGPTHIWTSLTRATLIGQLVGRKRRIPVVSWQHAAFLKPANRVLLRATRNLSRLWIGDSGMVTQLTAKRLRIAADRLVCWPIFRADPMAPVARPRREGKIRIGSLGRLHPVKGYDVLIKALGRLPGHLDYELLICGDGKAHDALEQRAVALGVPVRFCGFVADPRAFLSTLDLYVQPSRSEGLCVAAHEAMQAGLPVIASAVGELPYSIVEGETGWTVPPGDAGALADCLSAALADPARLPAMGVAGRKRLFDRLGPESFDQTGLAILERIRAF